MWLNCFKTQVFLYGSFQSVRLLQLFLNRASVVSYNCGVRFVIDYLSSFFLLVPRKGCCFVIVAFLWYLHL